MKDDAKGASCAYQILSDLGEAKVGLRYIGNLECRKEVGAG